MPKNESSPEFKALKTELEILKTSFLSEISAQKGQFGNTLVEIWNAITELRVNLNITLAYLEDTSRQLTDATEHLSAQTKRIHDANTLQATFQDKIFRMQTEIDLILSECPPRQSESPKKDTN